MSVQERKAGQENGQAAVAFEGVCKGFNGRTVLDGLSFEIKTGEALCVLGRSGTGKSVMLKLMIGLLTSDSGKVLVQGKDVGSMDPDALAAARRHMGYMFQDAALFDFFNLHDNLALPLRRLMRMRSKDEIERSVQKTLKQVGLEKDGAKMPATLSGGMQKRAGLARALALEPQILLVDEPHSGLDRLTAQEITDLLCGLKNEKHTTMVIVTHDVHAARQIADKMAVLDKGKLIGFGTVEELDNSDNELVKRFTSER